MRAVALPFSDLVSWRGNGIDLGRPGQAGSTQAEQWHRGGVHPRRGRLTVEDFVGIVVESVPNFRDLDGYRTHDGRTVAWRRVFRSAALHKMNAPDIARLKQDISPRAVIDLRGPKNAAREVHLVGEIGATYYPTPFSTWPFPGPSTTTSMGKSSLNARMTR